MRYVALFACGLMLLAAPQRKDEPELWLQAAIQAETVDGDLKSATEQYKKVIARQSASREVVAKALVRLGECYEKLGSREARKIYERVLREYADQKEAAAEARARLGHHVAAASASGIVTRQVWTGPKLQTVGSVSPDSRIISFTDWSTGDLALHVLATGEDRRLTNKGSWMNSDEYAYDSVFSRDGRQVAYTWHSPKNFVHELRLFDLNSDSGKTRVLFANRDVRWLNVFDWTPDHKWLVVQLWRGDRTGQMGLVSTADGALRVLKSANWRGASNIACSPDGRYLAYDLPASDDSEQREIYVMATDASRETPVVTHPANDRVLGWSPDGKHLLFASNRSGSNGVWALPVADGKSQGEAKLIKADIDPNALGLTRSGVLYYSVRVSGLDVYVASADFQAGKLLSPPANVAQQYVGFNNNPKWSPDGKYLAYLSRRGPTENADRMTVLAIRSTETGKVRELTPNLNFYDRPLWSPDGSFLVVTGTDSKGRWGIHRIDGQSGETTAVVMSDADRHQVTACGWSPDGKILFIWFADLHSKEGVIVAREVRSGQEREIVRRGGLSRGADVTPDGRWLAITTADPDNKTTSLLLLPTAGGEPRELLRVRAPQDLGGGVEWSPDGSFLLFAKYYDNRTRRETWRISAEGGTPDKLELNGWGHRIHPDARRVAFVMGDRFRMVEVWAMENFLPVLQASR